MIVRAQIPVIDDTTEEQVGELTLERVEGDDGDAGVPLVRLFMPGATGDRSRLCVSVHELIRAAAACWPENAKVTWS